VALGAIKLGILLQCYRIFSSKMRKIAVIVMVVSGMWATGLILVSIFTCHPIPAFWDQTITPDYCIPNLPQWYINAAGNIATDLVIFALPIPVLWKLQLPRGQRLSLVAVFGLGFFTCTISLIRLAFLNLNADPFYDNVAAALWSSSEMYCGIVASCLPVLRPMLWRFMPETIRTAMTAGGKSQDPSAGYHRTYDSNKRSKGLRSYVLSIKGEENKPNPGLSSSERRNSSAEELTRPTDAEFEMVTSPGGTTRQYHNNDLPIQAVGGGDKRKSEGNANRDENIGLRQGTYTKVHANNGQANWDTQPTTAGIKVQTDVVMISDKPTR
jgi:hypothetical protein